MAKVYDLQGNVVEEMKLPGIFSTDIRPDVVKRAVLAIQSARRQPYGSDPLAGKRTSAHYHGRRKYRFTMMNREMARMARIHGKVGYLAFTARFVPQAVKGRRAHPPKAEKNWTQRLNRKEHDYAIRSALAASADINFVKLHHRVEESPIILVDEFENFTKTKDIANLLNKLMPEEMKRCSEKKIRAGKGKMRGRRYRKKKGPVIITSHEMKAAKNIPGIDSVDVERINAEILAPGAVPGRMVIITKAVLAAIQKKFGNE